MNVNASAYLKTALRNYLMVTFLSAAVFISSFIQKHDSELILLKVLLAPIFWLALKGPDALFKYPVYEGKFTYRAMEYSMIYAFVLSCFTIYLSAGPGVDIWRLFTVCAVLCPLIGVLLLIIGIKRPAR